MKNPWFEFDYQQANQVHAIDQEVFDTFNNTISKSKLADKFRLQDSVSPQPYFGNKHGSLVILLANPGFLPGSTEAEETSHGRKVLDLSRKHQLEGNPFVYFLSELNETPGQIWWQRRLRRLIDATSLEAVSNEVFSVELHPYKSISYRAPKDQFPTQHYTFDLVRQSMNNGASILLGRAKNEWFSAIPELESYRGLFRLKNPQNAVISAGNMQDGSFEALARKIEKSFRG